MLDAGYSIHPQSSTIIEMSGIGISPGEIQVWWTSVHHAEPQIEEQLRVLDDGERKRAARFRVEAARRRFIGARAVLRSILGRAVGIDAKNVAFAYGKHGKPRLAAGGPCFNTTDSGDVVVVALASEELGVDVEVVRSLTRRDRLARRICTDREIEALESMSKTERETALLRLWTCKEAGLKAIGTGLRGGMRNVEVDLQSGRPPRLRHLRGEIDGWTLLPVELQATLLCTIVIKGEGWRLVSKTWPPHST